MTRPQIRILVAAALFLGLRAPARADLAAYINKPEPAYKWEVTGRKTISDVKIYDIHLVSQTWQGMNWEHHLELFVPKDVEHPEFCALLNTGGHGGEEDESIGVQVANSAKTSFAILFDIPNQPLFASPEHPKGLVEDQIIAYTWNKFLETGDESWPLHFPMAKAVIKAMDALQAFVKQEKLPNITGFVITGASKRGWTTWLAAATGDKRIKGIAPMVIDTLNLPKQVPHQIEVYGAPSESVKDYTVAGLQEKFKTPRGKRLIELEDPYSYRNILTMPKLLVFGTNDPYWSQDSLNLYWDDLKGPKWILYCPNSGHDLANGVSRILNTVPAFIRDVASHKSLPHPKWVYKATPNGGAELTITADRPIKDARLFHVEAPTQDFRKHRWTSETMTKQTDGAFKASLDAPESGYRAMYGEVAFEQDGKTFTLSTQIRILAKKK